MWHASGTAGEDERGSDLLVLASARVRARPSVVTTCLVGKSPKGSRQPGWEKTRTLARALESCSRLGCGLTCGRSEPSWSLVPVALSTCWLPVDPACAAMAPVRPVAVANGAPVLRDERRRPHLAPNALVTDPGTPSWSTDARRWFRTRRSQVREGTVAADSAATVRTCPRPS